MPRIKLNIQMVGDFISFSLYGTDSNVFLLLNRFMIYMREMAKIV